MISYPPNIKQAASFILAVIAQEITLCKMSHGRSIQKQIRGRWCERDSHIVETICAENAKINMSIINH